MKKIGLIFFLLSFMNVNAQLEIIKSIELSKPSIATTDYLGNFYIVCDKELWMINNGDSIYKKFSLLGLAELTSIDASNALRIQLYYKDLGKIVYLDNKATDLNLSVDLSNYDLAQASLVCNSYDNATWIYLSTTQSLYRYDRNFNKIISIENITQFLKTKEFDPIFLKEYSNLVYIYDKLNGIICFDIFGAYVKTITLPNIIPIDIQNEKFIYWEEEKIHFMNLENPKKIQFEEIPQMFGFKSAYYSYGKFFVVTKNNLFIYKIQK